MSAAPPPPPPAAIEEQDLLVRTQPTPNPMALKFILNQPLKRDGKATFHALIECEHLPLLKDVFLIPGVRQVHVFQNTLTVTHSGELGNEALMDQVCAVLRTRYAVHNPEFGEAVVESQIQPKDRSQMDPVLVQIEEILDRTVRPGLQADGGDIEVLQFANNELHILYQGACGGCPSSMMGTLEAIKNILRQEMGNDQITVVPANS